MGKKKKNKDIDEFGNITFGEATELLVDIIGQIVILEFIPKEKQEAYKRSLERMYDGEGTYSKFATASSESPQSYMEQFFKKILEERYGLSRLAMIIVDSFTWQLFNALTCTTTFEKPKKETALCLIRKELFNLIYHNLLMGKSFDGNINIKISGDSIITFLTDSYDKIFSFAENDFNKNGKVFINELKEYWNENYKNCKNVHKTDPLQEIINELLNDGGIFYKQINEIKISYKNNFDELKEKRPKLYDLLCIDKNDKHFDNIFKKAIEEFIEYGTDKYLSIDSLIIVIPKSKIKYPYLYRYIDSGKIDPSEIDFNFDDNIQKMRKGNVFNPTWKTLKLILDFLLENDKKSLISRLVGLYLLKNAQRAMKEILYVSEQEQGKIIVDIVAMINENKEPEEFYKEIYNNDNIEFLEQSDLINMCLTYQYMGDFDIVKSDAIIKVIEVKCPHSKKFFSTWLRARANVFEKREKLRDDKEEQRQIIEGYKTAYNEGIAYAGEYLAQFLLEAITINLFCNPKQVKDINDYYGYGYALELFDTGEKQKLFDIIKESNDPLFDFIDIQYSVFNPVINNIDKEHPDLHSLLQFKTIPETISEFRKKSIELNNEGLKLKKDSKIESLMLFSKAIMLNHAYVNAYSSRGCVFEEMGEHFENEGISDKNILNPEQWYSRALADFNMALLLDPKHENTLFNRGLLFLKKGQYENAITDFTNLIDINPEDSEARLQLNKAIFLEKLYLLENRRKNTLTMLKLHDIFERGIDYD